MPRTGKPARWASEVNSVNALLGAETPAAISASTALGAAQCPVAVPSHQTTASSGLVDPLRFLHGSYGCKLNSFPDTVRDGIPIIHLCSPAPTSRPKRDGSEGEQSFDHARANYGMDSQLL